MKILDAKQKFFEEYNKIAIDGLQKKFPAFFTAHFFLLGVFTAIGSSAALMIFLISFMIAPQKRHALFFFAAMTWCVFSTKIPFEDCEGTGAFKIEAIKESKRNGFLYSGTLLTFTDSKTNVCKNVKATLFSKKNYSINHQYRVTGFLKKKKGFFLKTDTEWRLEKKGSSIASYPMMLKQKALSRISTFYKNPQVSSFFNAITCGHLDDKQLRIDFQRLGISHILAISGFHFALIAFFLKKVLFFIPIKPRLLLLILMMNSYCLFLGGSSSILRANLMLTTYFLAPFFGKKSSGLNSLGIALIFELLLYPLSCTQLSFQLTFLATTALFLMVEPMERLLELWIPKKQKEILLKKNLFSKLFYLLASYFRTLLATTLAVHITLLPLLLSVFHTFNLHSLLYNLFLPFGFSFSLLLFLLACTLFPISSLLHAINELWTGQLLDFCENTTLLSKSWLVEDFPPSHASWVIFLSIFLGWRFFSPKSRGVSIAD